MQKSLSNPQIKCSMQLENLKIALKAARAVSKNIDERAAIYVKLNLENDTPLRSLLIFCPQVEWKEYWLLKKFHDLKKFTL